MRARGFITPVAVIVLVHQLLACAGDGDPDNPGGRRTGPASGASTAGVGSAGGAGLGGPSGFGNPVGLPAAGTGVPLAGSGAQAGEGAECGAVSQMAENMLQPADIIIGIDTSGSMSEEVAEVQENLNRFSQLIIDSGIDVRVIVLSTLQGTAMAGGVTVDGPCIAPPLGSGQCPSDSNPPAYVHVDTMVASWDVLDVYVNAYPTYKMHLRENSLKTFVTISDDNADSETSPFGILGGRPVLSIPRTISSPPWQRSSRARRCGRTGATRASTASRCAPRRSSVQWAPCIRTS